MKDEKLVITGMGAVTPIGIGVDNYWQQLIHGVCGIQRITKFDVDNLPVQIGAEIKNYCPLDHMTKSLAKATDPFAQFAFIAASEALSDSNLSIDSESERIGIVMGTAMDGVTSVARTQHEYSTGAIRRVGPRFVPMIIGNIAAAQIAIHYGIYGPSFTLNTACSSGGDAIMTAAMLLHSDEADSILVVGGESIFCPIILSGLTQSQALSRRNDAPEKACRPFDMDRDGFVIGEGGGAVIIETESHALARGAKIYATLAGYANTNDGYHITAPEPEGKGAIACMRRALQRSGLTPSEIGYINAHGTSTLLGDRAETQAIKEVFGDIHSAPPVSSTKGSTGHLMGAGGITEVITCIKAILEETLPPTLNYDTPDPLCDLDYIPNKARPAKISAAMSNSLGFGGQNSSIIVKKYES